MPYNQDGSQDGTEELTDGINKDCFVACKSLAINVAQDRNLDS